MVYGLIPLLVIGVAVVIVLVDRLGQTSAAARPATARAQATVVASGLGADRHEIDLRWTDDRSVSHTSRLRFPQVRDADTGTTVTLHYDPADTSRVFVAGDQTSVRLANLLNGITVVIVLMLTTMVTTMVRITRRRAAERQPAVDRRLAVSHSRRGLTTRIWLTEEENGHTWWMPVYWDPALEGLDPKRSYPVHGAADHRSLRVVEVDGTPIWPAGRRRLRTPRGEVRDAAGPRTGARGRISLRRHLRGDLTLVFTAPLLALLWAYVDGSGAAGFWFGSVVLAGVLFWVPSVYASDPT
ncbi:MAG TPA: hypothetical protein VIS06_19015 [Mycobacteriales bacterium]